MILFLAARDTNVQRPQHTSAVVRQVDWAAKPSLPRAMTLSVRLAMRRVLPTVPR